MERFFEAMQALGWAALIASALSLATVPARALIRGSSMPAEWAGLSAAALAAALWFLLRRRRRGPIAGRWQLWIFVLALILSATGGVIWLRPDVHSALAAGPLALGAVFFLLAVERPLTGRD